MTSVNKENQATLYDFLRYCDNHHKGSTSKVENCLDCELFKKGDCVHFSLTISKIHEINEIILEWCKEHSSKTKQDRFLKMFPNAKTDCEDILLVTPCFVEKDRFVKGDFNCPVSHGFENCTECRKKYWNEEIE